jgi:RNA polymerase sigma-70 factor (ECF subfamily)
MMLGDPLQPGSGKESNHPFLPHHLFRSREFLAAHTALYGKKLMHRSNVPISIVTGELLARARAGDLAAENELFERLSARIRALAKKRVWDPQAAEDLAQETLKTVCEKYREVELPRGLLPWVFMVFHHKMGNYLKRERTRSREAQSLDDLSASSEDEAIQSFEIWECLEKALHLASPECRTIFRVLLSGGDRAAMLATFPGDPEGTVDSRLSRCRKRLLEHLEREMR